MTTVKTSLLVSVLLLFAGGNAGAEITPYSDSLELGDYVQDVNGLLERAFNYDRWQLKSGPDENTYIGFLSHREIEVTVRISVQDQVLTLSLESAFQTGCASPCNDLGDKRPVDGWLINLRRAIALELTTLVRDELQSQM